MIWNFHAFFSEVDRRQELIVQKTLWDKLGNCHFLTKIHSMQMAKSCCISDKLLQHQLAILKRNPCRMLDWQGCYKGPLRGRNETVKTKYNSSDMLSCFIYLLGWRGVWLNYLSEIFLIIHFFISTRWPLRMFGCGWFGLVFNQITDSI